MIFFSFYRLATLGSVLYALANPALGFTMLQPSVFGYDSDEVTLHINPTNCPSTIYADLNSAVDLWNSVPTSGLNLVVGANTAATASDLISYSFSDSHIVIACSTSFASDSGGSCSSAQCLASVPALGAAKSVGENLVAGYVLINQNVGVGGNYGNKSDSTRQITMAHELGHALGLGHSEFQPALMHYSVTGKTTLSLSQDDIDGIQYLYGRNELSGGDLPLGCGTITVGPLPTNLSLLWLLILSLPGLLLMGLWLTKLPHSEPNTNPVK